MEESLDKQLDDTMNVHGVVGVLAADHQGLCLASKGNAQVSGAGLMSSLAEAGKQLSSDEQKCPVVCLESDTCNILIKSHDNVTMAIYKVAS
ncbi:ragulator complex protein LAMTOR5 homolog [Saccoglossus kowalevskii]|uniref:Late endosomal/lysosomal adaptor and MAPK and MTOR activator 5 n=1 Tax=Saccoglossus kowalevskii TaxID=10224 RepID=A0ABM0GKW8_SACKO|nr:PREDICTED: ragulator complex protein LAMTOR5 homolog [Saccoglossus kowalevskii]